MATATQIKDLQTRLDVLFGKGKVKSTEDTWSENKAALDTMEAAGKTPILDPSGTLRGSAAKSKTAEVYSDVTGEYQGLLSHLSGEEGYNPNFYLDGSGILTTGVGLTGGYVADPSPLRAMTEKTDQAKKLVPNYANLHPQVQLALVDSAYRGDLTNTKDGVVTPQKWVTHVNNGEFDKAAAEHINHSEYNKAKGLNGVNRGLIPRFDWRAAALKRSADPQIIQQMRDRSKEIYDQRAKDKTTESNFFGDAFDSVSGWIDEAFSTGEIPKDKVPSIKTQEIPVPEQGAAVPKSENEMATQAQVDSYLKKRDGKQEAQAYFKDFNTLDSLPSMGSRLVAPMQQFVEDQVIPVDSYSPGVDMNVKPKPMYPLAGTVTKEPQDTGPAQFAEIETLFNEPKTYVPASGRMDAYSYIDNTIPPHASEFSQAYVAPVGRDPAGIPVQQQQQGIVKDQFGNPVKSGNGNVIGLPTQNPAYRAPAGGKGANATPQSAIDQLTGVKGFGGK